MVTITEDYVSFETAKILKEMGFDEKCTHYYKNEKYLVDLGYANIHSYVNSDLVEEFIAPTLQMAMKWLREVHNLHIMVNCIGKVNYDPIVQRFDGKDFEIEGVEVGTTRRINGKWEDVRRGFKTYEEACEAAIKYCLENLI